MTDRATRPEAFAAPSQREPLGHGAERALLDGRRPRLLDDVGCALQVAAGHVDLFAVPIEGGAASGSRSHLCRIETGEIILSLPFVKADSQEQPLGALAVGGQGAETLVLDRRLIDDREALATWIGRLCSAIAEAAAGWGAREAQLGATFTLEAGDRIRAPGHGIAWVVVDDGEIALMGSKRVCRFGDPALPLASRTWAEARGETRVRVVDSGVQGSDLWPAIDRFHELAMGCVAERVAAAKDAEFHRLDQRAVRAATQGAQLFNELAAVLALPRGSTLPTEGADPLLDACRVVAEACGAQIVSPPERTPIQRGLTDAAAIAQFSRLRSRLVLLRGDWWHRDVGPLIAWHGDTREPVAIVPISPRHHLMVEPGKGARRRVDAAIAAALAPEALMLYAPPPLEPRSAKLLGFCLRKGYHDVVRILLSAGAVGVLGLSMPLITEVLIDSVIPRAEFDQLAYCATALAMVAIGVVGFQAVQNVGVLRLEGVLDRTLQAGIIDRLLRLPVSFFRQYTVGDLTDRVLGIDSVRRIATGHTIRGLLAGVFALISFSLMFYFDTGLALTAAGLTVLRGAVIVLTSVARLKHERRHFELDGNVQGLVLQLITGVGKLRVAFATERALAIWARKFAEQKRQFVASRRIANLLSVFEAGFPTIATLAIFAGAGHATGRLALDTGQFLAFFAAFGQSLAAGGELAAAIGESLIAIPLLDRFRPLITEPAEIAEHRNLPGELTGDIELRQVTFRYTPNGPVILNRVTLQVRKGEYLAVVGPSGSGKSTLFRLLLGFEKAESGAVFFDGKAIDALDISAIRRQIGVVLQNGKLASGSLYENICCGAQLPLDRAWDAARLAGLDSDIEVMPMGMHTVIGEGMNTLSGGQRQRLMIARALVQHPRILLFDEATSALDNRTQAIVSASLAQLNVTRIVIAQRLSTVRSADRIIVVAGGEIVQSGSFEELAGAPGMFADFAQRQLL
jgi:NHLM bacteriocin system ABC transporter ATP-binding protein